MYDIIYSLYHLFSFLELVELKTKCLRIIEATLAARRNY